MEGTKTSLWLEIIKVRPSRGTHEIVKDAIRTFKSDPGIGDAEEIRIFSNVIGDLAIHISRQSDKVESEGSSIGLRLAAALSEYGLINHTTWTEEV